MFEATLDRLSGTRLKTNIEMGNLDYRSSFGLIEQSDYIIETDASGKKRMQAIEITLSKWLYRAMEEKNVLTISSLYFTLRKPLEKKLYELARKHVGTQPDWCIKEVALFEKVGSRADIREFRRMLKEIIVNDKIPEYRIVYTESINHEHMIRFYQKDVKKFVLACEKRAKLTGGKKD
jgi:plasmid replication initiation protein